MRVRNVECGTRSAQWMCVWANSALRTPRSELAVKHRRLFSAAGRSEAKMPVRGYRGDAAARRAREEALLHQERLVHFLERPRVLAPGGAHRLQAPGTAPQLFAGRLQDAGVPVVEPRPVPAEPLPRLPRPGSPRLSVRPRLG